MWLDFEFQQAQRRMVLPWGIWSTGMILDLGARGSDFDSLNAPLSYLDKFNCQMWLAFQFQQGYGYCFLNKGIQFSSMILTLGVRGPEFGCQMWLTSNFNKDMVAMLTMAFALVE